MGLKKKSALASTLFWAVISAAFIGPGTVTTASKAGSSYGLSLLWALLFSTMATIVLQEAVARIRIGSGLSLGEIIREKFPASQKPIRWFLFLAVAFGCIAYEAGNLIGAMAGLRILFPNMEYQGLMVIGLVAFILLWTGTSKDLARIMGVFVALMGMAYILVAVKTPVAPVELVRGAFVPGWENENAAWVAIALIGTTIVPYNLFLGSGLSGGQSTREMRSGLIPAILFGGFISMAILIVGTRVDGPFSFGSMALALGSGLGGWALKFFGFGLFAAGITSAVTAPFAASMTGQVLLASEKNPWQSNSVYFRMVWMITLIAGLFFSLTGIRPIPAIIGAQAINGLILPFVTWVIWILIKDRSLLGRYANTSTQQAFLFLILLLTLGLGGYNIFLAVSKLL